MEYLRSWSRPSDLLALSPLARRYGLALLVTAAAALVEWTLQSGLLLPFIVATFLSARWGGLGPGLLTAGLGMLLSILVFSPTNQLDMRDMRGVGRLGLFVLTVGLVVWLNDERRREGAQRRHLLTVLEQAPVSMIIARAPDGRVELWNTLARQIYGRPPSDFLAGSLAGLPLRHPDGRPYHHDDLPLVRALHGQTVLGAEVVVPRAGGGRTVLLVNAAPLVDEHGVIIGAAAAGQDISERRAMEELKDEFLSLAAHELKTPLTVVKGNSQLLLHRYRRGRLDLTDQDAQTLRLIDEKTDAIAGLVNELLDLSQVETGQLELRPARMDLAALLRRVIAHRQPVLADHPMVLRGADQPVVGVWDWGRLEQAVTNLLDNAAKYSSAGAPITVTLERLPEGTARVSIADCGIGIPADELGRVFEKHFRARNNNRDQTGLGLGLYLTSQIVQRHGGTITVESVEGQGSTFRITLPLARPNGD